MVKPTQADVMRLADKVRQQIPDEKIMRFVEAYLMMAVRARYRPGAPSDGFGHIQLSEDEFKDETRLLREAVKYAVDFDKEEDKDVFHIGCSDFRTNRAFLLSIEAARLLASGLGSESFAIKVLQMAIEEIRTSLSEAKRKRREAA